MNDKRISIHEQKLWPTQLWTTRLENFCRQPRKVSENEDMINYIMSDYENNSKIIEKSNRYGGWQSHTDYYLKPVFKNLCDKIWAVSKATFPMIKAKKIKAIDLGFGAKSKHPLVVGPLGEYFDHLKGPSRKQLGYSKERKHAGF